MRNMDAATIARFREPVIRVAYLALIEFDAPYRLAFTTLLRNYVFEGDTFTGFGDLGSITPAASSGDLAPSNYEIKLSGVTDGILEAAGTIDYMNKRATVWAMTLDDNDEPDGVPFIWFRGLTDSVNVTIGESPSVTIAVRDRTTDWERPRISRYTDGDQQAMFPGDRGFEFVTQIASRDVEWPADTWFKKNS